MWQIKCDKCKKIIKQKEVMVDAGYPNRYELCLDCGKPIITFLKRNSLYKEKPKFSV
ncbi:hypothetical protein KKC88_05085 [Patescibacteria group bacterium]|nr:hypothetical protein [Patescibacteria group bacterium]MBU1673701.1 hypothetical protein [Patescibacteria group bacterium]MBU1963070.1 hypothetical protein [Patescibacteria group bacterium]